MAGAPVIIDPKDLRQFAAQLKQFNSELTTSSARINGQFRQLGDTWRDPAYQKFAQEFDQTMKNIRRFQQVSEEVIPRLIKTAERAEGVHRS
jgi:WXG100 family type VII secretion target